MRWFPLLGTRWPPLPWIHLWLRTAAMTEVQADGWLTFSLLTCPISAVLAQWGGGRAKRRLGIMLCPVVVLFRVTRGRWVSLLFLLLLAFRLQMCRKLLNSTIRFAVCRFIRLLVSVTLMAACLTCVVLTRDVSACP